MHGSVIVAKSITAEKVQVDDLVAFGATIGGFKIGTNSLYSGVKASVDNTTRGIYMDDTGQMAFGDTNNYVKFFKDTDGSYKLAIAAEYLTIGPGGKSVEDTINELQLTTNLMMHIESSSGTAFAEGQNGTTTLLGRIYQGSKEIDAAGEFAYMWYAVNGDGAEQTLGAGKSLTVSIDSIAGKGVYFTANDGDDATSAIIGVATLGQMILGNGG